MDSVRAKLDEASTFLGRLCECENLPFGDRENAETYLNGFLSAAKAFDNRLCGQYKTFRDVWLEALEPSDRSLLKFIVEARRKDVHEASSGVIEKIHEIPVFNSFGGITVSGPPGVPVTIHKPVLYFNVDGQEIKATECCGRCLQLMRRLIEDFETIPKI